MDCGNEVIYGWLLDKTNPVAIKTASLDCPYCHNKLGYDSELACVEVSNEKWDISHKACFQGFAIGR